MSAVFSVVNSNDTATSVPHNSTSSHAHIGDHQNSVVW